MSLKSLEKWIDPKEALLHEYLTLEDDDVVEDDTENEVLIDQKTSILVNSTKAKNSNPTDVRNLLSTIHKNKTNFKTNVHKASTSVKELVFDGVIYSSVKNHNIMCSTSKFDRVCNN